MPKPDNQTKSLLAYKHTVVAIDLGSNSFHLLLARPDGSQLDSLITMGHKVQLGLDMKDNRLSDAAIKRGLDCLKAFAEHTRGRRASSVRIVGTQALRAANNSDKFIAQARTLLEQDVEIISGKEEAELVYLGVEKSLNNQQKILAIDVGGGSTEIVAGCGNSIAAVATVPVGCVSSLSYFPDGGITAQAFTAAIESAYNEFAAVSSRFNRQWSLAVGCSGTLLAIEQVLIQQGWVEQGISREGLERLKYSLLSFDKISAVVFQGLNEDRQSIFATGVAIVLALFDSFAIESMVLSPAGLREGVAWSLLR